MTDAPFEVVAPTGRARPVIVHVPHASTSIPGDVRDGIVLDDAALAEELRRITDHRTDVLAADVGGTGATRFVNRRSRLVVDPERFPDPAREVMEQRGMGAVYTSTTDGEQLRPDDAAARRRLLDRYFAPYAAAFAELVARRLDDVGRCTIVDLHSYPTARLPYELGGEVRPPLCVGTDAFHTPAWLRDLVVEVAADHGVATALDSPFRGTYVPLELYGSDDRVTSVMLEVRRDLYLDEVTARPHAGEADVRALVRDVVATIGERQPA